MSKIADQKKEMKSMFSLFFKTRDTPSHKTLKRGVATVTAMVVLAAVSGATLNSSLKDSPIASKETVSSFSAMPVMSLASATTATKATVQYKTTISLNFRSGPGFQYKILSNAKTGTVVTATGKTSGVWYQVKLGKQTGWMSSDYLKKYSAPSPTVSKSVAPSVTLVQYKTTISLNFRSGPGTQYKILGNGTIGTTVVGTGKTSGVWYQVKLNNQTGWMSSDYLLPITGSNSVAALQSFAGSKLNDSKQLKCLVTLWERESNWNYKAINPAFNPNKPNLPEYQAFGIAQAAPGNKMASSGTDWKTNPRTQISWGLDYISGRYGTPCKALDHSYSVGWY